MYPTFLVIHSYGRWLVLIALLVVLLRVYFCWKHGSLIRQVDGYLRVFSSVVAGVQITTGLALYFISPIVAYFYSHFPETIHLREVRFFGMEHSSMMLTALLVFLWVLIRLYQPQTDSLRYKKAARWLTLALFMILTSIPWSFWPLVSRPLFR